MTSVIATIKDRLPITDVLSSYITLIPAGNQYKAKCPFHNERTASFSVSPERGLYYCFGCAAKGDIFTFVQQFEGVDFKGSLKILAERAGVPLEADYGKREDADPVYEILEKAAMRYEGELRKNKDALEYLAKRGVTPETIAQFRIGYAPDEWRYIATGITEQEQVFAERAGLIKKTEKGYYDRFRSRIMFPLCDSSGRVVGFSGRIFPEKEGEPKYLNSPETEVFQKSRILFGFDKAKFAIKKHGFAILVEGQMDVILSHQAGFKNTVASSGTAVSDTSAEDKSANLAVLSRLTPHIFLAFDGDKAGQKALERAAGVALQLGMNPKVVPLPEGVDPADYLLKHDVESWKGLLKGSQHFILHELAIAQAKKPSAHVLVQTLRERLFPFLSRIPSPIERNLYIETIGREIGISPSEVLRELALFMEKYPVLEQKQSAAPASTNTSAKERFLALVTRYPGEEMNACLEKLKEVSFDEAKLTLPEVDESHMPALLAAAERECGEMNDEARIALAKELAEKITKDFFNSLRDQYSQALKEAERAGDEEKIASNLAKLQTLNQRRHGD
jgi:DNA primase